VLTPPTEPKVTRPPALQKVAPARTLKTRSARDAAVALSAAPEGSAIE